MDDRRAASGDHDNRFSAGYFQLDPNENHEAAQENGNIRREGRGMRAAKNWSRMAARDPRQRSAKRAISDVDVFFFRVLCVGVDGNERHRRAASSLSRNSFGEHRDTDGAFARHSHDLKGSRLPSATHSAPDFWPLLFYQIVPVQCECARQLAGVQSTISASASASAAVAAQEVWNSQTRRSGFHPPSMRRRQLQLRSALSSSDVTDGTVHSPGL